MNIDTASAMAAAAFENAIRMHRDAVFLFRNRRYPSAFGLSILSQEEIGKTFQLEEFVYRVNIGEWDANDSSSQMFLKGVRRSHESKQLWFARLEFDHGDPSFREIAARFVDQARSGRLERQKQDATYVGRLDVHGRIQTPASYVTEEDAAREISRVADLLRTLVDGYLDDHLVMDSADLEACLTPDLEAELDDLWPTAT